MYNFGACASCMTLLLSFLCVLTVVGSSQLPYDFLTHVPYGYPNKHDVANRLQTQFYLQQAIQRLAELGRKSSQSQQSSSKLATTRLADSEKQNSALADEPITEAQTVHVSLTANSERETPPLSIQHNLKAIKGSRVVDKDAEVNNLLLKAILEADFLKLNLLQQNKARQQESKGKMNQSY